MKLWYRACPQVFAVCDVGAARAPNPELMLGDQGCWWVKAGSLRTAARNWRYSPSLLPQRGARWIRGPITAWRGWKSSCHLCRGHISCASAGYTTAARRRGQGLVAAEGPIANHPKNVGHGNEQRPNAQPGAHCSSARAWRFVARTIIRDIRRRYRTDRREHSAQSIRKRSNRPRWLVIDPSAALRAPP
jgi:hypothetical protein